MKDAKALNEQQIAAIEHGKGPLLIIAGAGTGKTTVVTERIKHLVLQKKVLPSQILALTFTEKASREMEERVDVAMPYGYTQMWISTFHAFCDRILRAEAIHIGLNPAYTLTSEAENILFLRKNIFLLQLDYFRPLGNPAKFLSGLLQHFSRLKDEDIGVEEYLNYAEKLRDKEADADEIKKTLELANAYKTYEILKTKEGIMDFSGLIGYTLLLFRKRPNILKNYQEQFEYILVDEFQDTNFAQNQLSILLAGEKKNITVVGDDDQAIYRWRGAAIYNMIQFKQSYPDTKIVTLTQNYRSTPEILDTSYTLIQRNNPDRLEVKEKINKKLTPFIKKRGVPVTFLFGDRAEEEASQVVEKIQMMTHNSQRLYKDFAILVRANDHAKAFVRELSQSGIPYQFLGPGQLFHQEEVKDLISYLKVLYNFEDSVSIYRILAMPLFNLDPLTIAALINTARRKNLSLFEAIEELVEQSNPTEQLSLQEDEKGKLNKLYQMIKNHISKVPKDTAGQILYYFLQDSGLLEKMLSAKNEKDIRIYQNIARFFDKLKEYETEHEKADVEAIVDWIDLSMQMGESPLATNTDWSDNNAVNILTIHSSKGLEFPVVFLVNLVSQRFPTRERREQIPIPDDLIKEILPAGDFHLQEERRLFYVGMTRAKEELYLTAAHFYGEGKREKKLSPFIYEALGEEKISKVLGVEKAKKSVVQQSLLEWVEKINQKNNSAKPTSNQLLETNDQRLKTKITYLSYSQIQCYDLCPLHYKLRYILKIPTIPSSSQSYGTSVHAVLRDFYQAQINGENPSFDKIKDILEKNWINDGYQSKDHEKIAFLQAENVIKNYLNKYFDRKTIAKETVVMEIPFQFFIANPQTKSSLKIGGRIDRIDKKGDTIEIIDYKTGKNMPAEKELGTNLQLSFYALAAENVHDSFLSKTPDKVTLSLHYLEEDKILTTSRTAEQLEETKKRIFEKVTEIEQSEFLCNKGIFCQNCEYKMLCQSR